MTDDEQYTLDAIRIWGGHFMKNLRLAYMVADADNRRKIRETWPKEWAQYTEQGRRLAATEEETVDLPAAEEK